MVPFPVTLSDLQHHSLTTGIFKLISLAVVQQMIITAAHRDKKIADYRYKW